MVRALSTVECVPMSLLSQVYSSAKFIKAEERIMFEIFDKKYSVSKVRFCTLLKLPCGDSTVNPESVTTAQHFEMFYNMGYNNILSTITKVKKSCLPPQWNGLFTLLFKRFSEQVVGSNGANKGFMTILYGLYHGINLDCGSILWAQLV